MTKKIIIGIVVVIILAAFAFTVWRFVYIKPAQLVTTTLFVDNATGTQVTPVLGTDQANKLIDESGGEIDLISDTINSKLTLPANVVADPVAIEMKKIHSISNLPSGIEFISGIEFAPDGTWLDAPADLQIVLPTNLSAKKLVGFSYSSDGKDFQLYPMQIHGTAATFKLNGFSGYGILTLATDTSTPSAPSTIEKQAQQLVAAIVSEGQSQTGGLNANQTNRIKNILTAWYTVSLTGALKDAEGNPDKIDSALHEYKSWLTDVQLFGLDDSFKTEIEAALNSLALAVKNASDKASQACTDEKDPTEASKLLRYYKITELVGLDGRSGLKSSDIQNFIKKCVSFKLTIKSRMIDGDEYKSSADATGEGAITLGDDMKLSGSGQVIVTDYHMSIDEESCTANTPEIWPFTIPPFSLVEAQTNTLALPFNLGEPTDVTWECGKKIREITGDENSGVWTQSSAWDFDLAHQDETADSSPVNYLLNDWDMVDSGEVFARKVYNRTVNVSLGGISYPIEEQTTFELVHQPK